MKKIFFLLIISFYIIGNASAEEAREEVAYKINPGDMLQISVYDEADLSKTVRVSQDGKIKYPLLGEVDLNDLTIEEATAKLEEALEADYLVNPQVTVFIEEHGKFNVLGEVKNPGTYELKGSITAVDAIAMAGGFTDIAHQNGVRVVREEKEKRNVIKVPVGSILKTGNDSRNIFLQEGDTVVVPETFF